MTVLSTSKNAAAVGVGGRGQRGLDLARPQAAASPGAGVDALLEVQRSARACPDGGVTRAA